MAIVVVLFTLLILVAANGTFNSSITVGNYVVDLGYQLNQGQAVVVSFVYIELYTEAICMLQTCTSRDLRILLVINLLQNETLVTFRNVRFAAPPVGPLRFLAPTLPAVNRTKIQNASDVI